MIVPAIIIFQQKNAAKENKSMNGYDYLKADGKSNI